MLIDAYRQGFFGYGRWDAPFWFIGIEPGGEELQASVETWHTLGGTELVDAAKHHVNHAKQWFTPEAPTQLGTYAKLIWLLLAYHGVDPTSEATVDYQRNRLGRADANGETALIELSATPSPEDSKTPPNPARVALIRERVVKHKPRFVVFYSPNKLYRPAWETIAGVSLERDKASTVDRTTFVVTYHTNGRRDKAYWSNIAHALRDEA
jgi:hypothetical protein